MDSILHTSLPFYNLCVNCWFHIKGALIKEAPGYCGFSLYESHYIADQNTLANSEIVRKLQLSEFEVSKRGSICSFHSKGRRCFALCVNADDK